MCCCCTTPKLLRKNGSSIKEVRLKTRVAFLTLSFWSSAMHLSLWLCQAHSEDAIETLPSMLQIIFMLPWRCDQIADLKSFASRGGIYPQAARDTKHALSQLPIKEYVLLRKIASSSAEADLRNSHRRETVHLYRSILWMWASQHFSGLLCHGLYSSFLSLLLVGPFDDPRCHTPVVGLFLVQSGWRLTLHTPFALVTMAP